MIVGDIYGYRTHRALANLVDAMEVETKHRFGNKLSGGRAGCELYRAISQGMEALGVELAFTNKFNILGVVNTHLPHVA